MPEQQPKEENERKKILIVEDDADLAESIATYLALENYSVTVVGSAGKCYVAMEATAFRIAILDLSLPDQDGLVLARYLRSNTRTIVLMLSARSTLDDRRMGYEAGAHLFMAKPVDFAELASAVAKLIHTASEPDQAAPIEAAQGSWRLQQSDGNLISPAGEELHLTTKEWDLLKLLAMRNNEVVPRECLLKALGYPLDEYGHRSLESILYRLRKKGAATGGLPLRTSHGNGYGFMAPLVLG